MNNRGIGYLIGFVYGATKYPSGWIRPLVVKGRFNTNTEKGSYQKMLFSELINLGFRRTFWQLVFPGQIGGLIKNAPGNRQYHIRFYSDGTIDCEVEMARWNLGHWTGKREDGNNYIRNLLNSHLKHIGKDKIKRIESLLGKKEYSKYCLLD